MATPQISPERLLIVTDKGANAILEATLREKRSRMRYILVERMVSYVERDDPEHGCDPDSSRMREYATINKRFKTIEEARLDMAREWILDKDVNAWAINRDMKTAKPNRLDCSQMEKEDGTRMTEKDIERWRKKEIEGFCVDYLFSFRIEIVEESFLTDEEIEEAGIQEH